MGRQATDSSTATFETESWPEEVSMSRVEARFPPDWFESQDGAPATDLDLAVLLVNTDDRLEDPPDRLTDVGWFRSALGRAGHPELARAIKPRELDRLRSLRAALRSAFEADDVSAAARVLNKRLVEGRAVPILVADDATGLVRYTVDPSRRGVDALEARLPAALAQHLADRGSGRLGICSSDPCRCAFVDRTRAGTRRYCCTWCNDRAAARAYRRRRRR
jgi:predicted RNA-binding Zn ribbon-like protein